MPLSLLPLVIHQSSAGPPPPLEKKASDPSEGSRVATMANQSGRSIMSNGSTRTTLNETGFGRESFEGKNFDPEQGLTISLNRVSLVVEVSQDQMMDGGPELGSGDHSLALSFKRSTRWIKRKLNFRVPQGLSPRSPFRKTVLRNVTGVINAGEMYALLGPSGAGKTTLLDVISRRKTVGQIKGEIAFDGKRISSLRLKTETAYIQQQDVLLGYFTVYEYILFHAFLKLPKWMTIEQKKARTTYAIEKLGLLKCKNMRIGEPLKRGVSGGERKRVCIALGLLTEPKCLFLDEPTSGLDSHISLEVMRVVKSLSNDGRTIICTIHQPSQVIYNLFDKLIVLQNGQVAYWGPGKQKAPKFFSNLGFSEKSYDNTAEYLLDVVSGAVSSEMGYTSQDLSSLFGVSQRCLSGSLRSEGSPQSSKASPKSGKASPKKGSGVLPTCLSEIPEVHENLGSAADGESGHHKVYPEGTEGGGAALAMEIEAERRCTNLEKDLEDLKHQSKASTEMEATESMPRSSSDSSEMGSVRGPSRALTSPSGYANSPLRELCILTAFKARAHFKDPHFLGTRIFMNLLFSLILTSFWGTSLESQKNISTGEVLELAGLLFIVVGTNAFLTTFFVPAIMEERPVFIKERHDACYRVFSYVAHKVVIEGMANIPGVILFSIPIYFATPLRNEWGPFFFFMLTVFTLNMCSSMLALAIASITPSMEVAGAVVPAIISLCALCGGFLKSFTSLPVWWQWFNVVDFIAWAYSALMMNQYQGQQWYYCLPPTELSSFLSGGSGGSSTSSSGEGDVAGAFGLIGDGGKFKAKCERSLQAPVYVDLDLQQCMLPVAMEVANSCFPPSFNVNQILSCEDICAPIEGDSVIKYFSLQWRMNKWFSLAILAVQVPVFFVVFFLASKYIKHESR